MIDSSFFDRLETVMQTSPGNLSDFDVAAVLATAIHYAFAGRQLRDDADLTAERIRELLGMAVDALGDRGSPLVAVYAEAVAPINPIG
jgi:hypothetical protein